MVINGRLCFMANSNKGIKINIKNDSKLGIHTALIRFPEPEIIDEIFDIRVGEKHYRVFVNRKLNRVTCNEIVSYDYKGVVLLKNPANTKVSSVLWEFFLEQNLRKEDRLDTVAHFRQKVEKLNKQEDLIAQSKKQPVGRKRSLVIAEAAVRCIELHSKNVLNRTEILQRACEKFKTKTHSKESFVKMLNREWNRLIKQYGREPKQIKDEKNLYIYAKNELKILRNLSKQKTNSD
jgi:hypothetical protein